MRKRVGFEFASLSISTPDGKNLAPKLQKLIWSFFSEMRPYDPNDKLDLASFMLYCSYVSRNVDDLGLDGFDPNYSIDEVKDKLGNSTWHPSSWNTTPPYAPRMLIFPTSGASSFAHTTCRRLLQAGRQLSARLA